MCTHIIDTITAHNNRYVLSVQPPQMALHAFTWTHMTLHGSNRSDWIMFIPPWCDMAAEDMDMNNKSHFAKVSYGRCS